MTERKKHVVNWAAAALLLLLLSVWISGISIATASKSSATADGQEFTLLLIVGDVRSTRARILYDLPKKDSSDGNDDDVALHVRVFVSTSAAPGTTERLRDEPVVYEVQQEFTVDRIKPKAPSVLQLDHLTPNRWYNVGLQLIQIAAASPAGHTTDNEEIVKFRTTLSPNAPASASEETRALEDRVLIVSCDRYVDDEDDTLWLQIIDDIEVHADSYFGMAHIGDQVYVDAGGASIPILPVPREWMMHADQAHKLHERYGTVVDQFRSIYHRTFGRPIVQKALRTGAHWMIPDDHEVINNFNFERVQRVLVAQDRTTSDNPEHLDQEQLWGLALHYRAGLQVYYEYQFQLQRDFPFEKMDFLFEPLDEIVERFPVYFAVEVHKLKLFFMDLRFDRSFFKKSQENGKEDKETLSKLVGNAQMRTLKQTLEHWSQDQKSAIVVLSAVPLFFHSTLSSAITYFVEKETYPGMAAQLPGLQALFEVFFHHSQVPEGKTSSTLKLLVGGDVHFLAHSQVCGQSHGKDTRQSCFDQLVTSGITKGSTAISDLKLVPFYFLVTRLTPFINSLITWTGIRLPGFSSPTWEIEYEKLFLGRNYGVIELSENGVFDWKASVVAPHEETYQDALQWIMDVSSSGVLGMLTFIFVAQLIIRMRRSRRKKEQKPQKAKTT